jgi:AcrR family transcriptional regulator
VPGRSAPRSATPARRAAILEAALACFNARGIEATTIEDIRRESACSTGTLYHHFKSKEGIACGLFMDGIKALNADLLRKLKRCRSAEAGVKTVVTQYCDWVTQRRALAWFLLHSREIVFAPEAKSDLDVLHRSHIREVFAWFGPYVANGQMKGLPIHTYVPLISAPIQDYTRHWLAGRVDDAPAKVKNVFAEAAWNAVKAE